MRFKVKYSYDGSVGPKHPDALHKPNANRVKKMKNIELEPRCMIKDNKNFSKYSSKMDFAVTNRGHLVPCCFIDQPEELDDPIKGKINGVPRWRNVRGGSKALQNRRARWTMHKEHSTVVCMAMSMNPPVDVMKERGFYNVAERKRDPGRSDEKQVDYGTYMPYLYVDKRFVAGVYEEHGLMKELYPMTKSCAWGPESGNTNYPDPCGRCFWCNEKGWAFGVVNDPFQGTSIEGRD